MKNEYMRPASELSLPVPTGTKAGDPVLVGSLVGVAATDVSTAGVPAGGNITGYASVLMDDRSYLLPVTGAVTGPGTAVYIPNAAATTSGQALTVTATSATLFGYTVPAADGSYATKGATAGPMIVKLAKI